MMLRTSLRTLVLTAFATLAACSGGGSAGSAVTAPACAGPSKFCLISCNLGCTVSGDCAISEIAQNQQIVLNFSQVLDPASLSGGSVQIRTASGESPAGQLLVDGSSIVFQPEARVVGGSTVFGFRPNETYVLTLPAGGLGSSLTSNSGDPLSDPVVCQLNVTQGVIDNDGQAPVAELITPSSSPAGQGTQIQVRFSELIDLSGFVGTTAATSPVQYTVRPTVIDPLDPNNRICDPGATPGALLGVPVASVDLSGQVPRTLISLSPTNPLPRRACIEVVVTDRVRDLAGTAASRQAFEFFVEEGMPTQLVVTETFSNTANIDIDASGGVIGNGIGVPSRIGGSGDDGSFDPELGQLVDVNTFFFSTTNTFLPADSRRAGVARTVTDGVYEFSDFVIPQGTRVIFRGAAPAVIKVSGNVLIEGELDLSGQSLAPFNSVNQISSTLRGFVAGQAGGLGGAGGSDGGAGGDSGDGITPLNDYDGKDGGNLLPPAFNPMMTPTGGYAGLTNDTGGKGTPQFPTSGVLQFPGSFPAFFNSIAIATAGGGGGGGYAGIGNQGAFLPSPAGGARPQDIGPNGVAGLGVTLVDVPMGLMSSVDHFLVGGSGGGGGGSAVLGCRTQQVAPPAGRWNAGAAGGGGGGALCIRAGRGITVTPSGAILCSGGSAGQQEFVPSRSTPSDWPTPGGGGSGGSVLLQCDANGGIQQGGLIDVSAGLGGRTNWILPPFQNELIIGGAGAPGFARLEMPQAQPLSAVGNLLGPMTVPALSSGALLATEMDDETVIVSRFRSAGTIFPPDYTSYEITARIGTGPGSIRTFTDANGNPAEYADGNNGPIEFSIQGATVAPGTSVGSSPGPFRSFVNGSIPGQQSINLDGATGFRWVLRFDLTAGVDIEVLEVKINAEG